MQPPEVFYQKAVLKNFVEFTENSYVGVTFKIKLQVKKSLRLRCFALKFANILRTTIL